MGGTIGGDKPSPAQDRPAPSGNTSDKPSQSLANFAKDALHEVSKPARDIIDRVTVSAEALHLGRSVDWAELAGGLPDVLQGLLSSFGSPPARLASSPGRPPVGGTPVAPPATLAGSPGRPPVGGTPVAPPATLAGSPGRPPVGGTPYDKEFHEATALAGVPAEWADKDSLKQLVSHESGFRPDAKNPGSTAYGMFQFIDSTWERYLPEVPYGTNDPKMQAVGGYRYIDKVYGDPDRAWAFWQATAQGDVSLAPPDLRDKAQIWIQRGYKGY